MTQMEPYYQYKHSQIEKVDPKRPKVVSASTAYLRPRLHLSTSVCRPGFTSHHNRIHLCQGSDKKRWEELEK